MADKAADEGALPGAALAQKYRELLEGLTDEELALYSASVGAGAQPETAGFAAFAGAGTSIAKTAGTNLINVFQDVVVNKAKTADKARAQMDAYLKQ